MRDIMFWFVLYGAVSYGVITVCTHTLPPYPCTGEVLPEHQPHADICWPFLCDTALAPLSGVPREELISATIIHASPCPLTLNYSLPPSAHVKLETHCSFQVFDHSPEKNDN